MLILRQHIVIEILQIVDLQYHNYNKTTITIKLLYILKKGHKYKNDKYFKFGYKTLNTKCIAKF